jgi:hypothetical protein
VLNISADFWQREGKKKLGEENLSGCEDFFRMADFPGMHHSTLYLFIITLADFKECIILR